MITGGQIRAACALLKWTIRELSTRSEVSWSTTQRIVSTDGVPSVNAQAVAAVQDVLEEAGIVFLMPGSMPPGGYGVRMRE